MAGAGLVDQCLAQGHEASALAIDEGPAIARGEETGAEAFGGAEGGAMQFGIAAGEEDGIGVGGGRLVGEGREEAEAGAGGAPAVEEVGIEEGEGGVAGHGDALAQRRQSGRRAVLDRGRCRQRFEGIEVDIVRHVLGGGIEEGGEAVDFAGEDEAEMAFGNDEAVAARQRPEQRQTGGGERRAQHALVARGGDAIEDEARDAYRGVPPRETGDERGDGLALPIGIDDEDHRQVESCGQLGGGTAAVGGAIEEPHDAFDDEEIRPSACWAARARIWVGDMAQGRD